MDYHWFQSGPIPDNAISGHYNLWLVALSYCIAVLASYVALDFAGRLNPKQSKSNQAYWIIGGAFAMGAGIWSMHFIGMLSFVMPMPMVFEFDWTAASLLIAILASGIALFILRNKNSSFLHLTLCGILIGIGIATMHYMGMEGMKSHVHIRYLPSLFILSILIAIGAAEAALWLTLQSNQGSTHRQFYLKIFSALIMGAAICGMHYTGMAAAIFTPVVTHTMPMKYQTLPPDFLAMFIAGITAMIISLALTVSRYYKKMIIAVQNEKEFLNVMLNNLEDGIIACDPNKRITVLNNAMQKNINYQDMHHTVNELLNYFDFYTTDNKPLTKEDMPLNQALKGERIHGQELVIHFKNNVIKNVVIDAQQIISAEKKILGAVMVIHDITELKKTERLKNEFVSLVNHELRTPLTSIRGSLGILTSGLVGEFTSKGHKLIEIANKNCDRLLLLINDLLDIEKIEAGKMEFQLQMTNLNNIVNESIEANRMYAEKFNVSIEATGIKMPIYVIADPGRLMQVLANLISNACKFSPSDSVVTVSIQQENKIGRVSVSDQGPGIPLEFQSRIFQKFSQADSSDTRGKGGTGLGLSISKALIEKMGGKLYFINKVNQGATFYFELPIKS